jgi:uncharacterized protein YjbI with pentapeptide repeats
MTGSPGTRLAPDLPGGPRAALVVATTRYGDPEFRQLRAPAHDARDLAEVLGDPGIGGFSVTQVIDADERRVRRAIDVFLSGRVVGDLVVVYLSCHGVLDRRNRLYFAASDTLKAQLGSTGIPAAWLMEELEECRARSKVLILDCCFSGAFAHGSKGDADLDLERRLAGHGRGQAVLTASRAGEYSFEGQALPGAGQAGSVFTAGLVEGLRTGAADISGDGFVSVDEAFDYAFGYVQSSGASQTPQRWLYGGEGEIMLARSPAGIIVTAAQLPEGLAVILDSPYPAVRVGAVHTLGEWLSGPDTALALAAEQKLRQIVDTEVPTVAAAAQACLDGVKSVGAERSGREPSAAKPPPANTDVPRVAHLAPARNVARTGRVGTPDFNERFTAITAQLGDARPAVRLAGVHAMAGLADDQKQSRQTCVDVLCAYLRLPYDPDPGNDADPAERTAYHADREVRRTAISVINAHLQAGAAVSWQGLNLDFTGAVFDGGNFARARFSGGTVTFRDAVFCAGTVDFTNADFSGGIVDFTRARFSGGTVSFESATFSGGGVSFDDATFSGGQVGFHRATLSDGRVDFAGAEFTGGWVNFGAADFTGGMLGFTRARFSGSEVDFDSVRVSGGHVGFTHARFSGGQVDFNATEFNGGTVDFSGAEFSGGRIGFTTAQFWASQVSFTYARFSGSTVDFGAPDFPNGYPDVYGAAFDGGKVAFDGATFSDGKVTFDLAEFDGGTVSFTDARFSGGTVDFTHARKWSHLPTFSWAGKPPTGVLLPVQPSKRRRGKS